MGLVKQRFLGSGSYGRVHLAVQLTGKMEIAVKSADLQNSDSLKREAALLDALRDCPHIVRYIGEDVSFEHGGHVYNLLIEYAPGGSLRQLIKSSGGGMPAAAAAVACYTYQLLKGICFMHSSGVFHCDLKPGNVLVFPGEYNGGNRLKLCDLGVAKFDGGVNVFGDSHRGTLLYAQPESVLCGSYEAAKDIWALGCIVVEMFTGKPMWQAGYKDDLAIQIAFTKPEIPNDIPLPAKKFLEMCLEREAQRRSTAEALLDHPFVRGVGVLESDEVDDVFVNYWTPWSPCRNLFTVASYHHPKPPSTFAEENVVLTEKDEKVDGESQTQNLGGEDKEAEDKSPIILPEVTFCTL